MMGRAKAVFGGVLWIITANHTQMEVTSFSDTFYPKKIKEQGVWNGKKMSKLEKKIKF